MHPTHALAALLASLTLVNARADVVEHASVVKYPVRVTPTQTVTTAINAASPIRVNGQVMPSFTKWSVQWHLQWARQSNGRCVITNVTTVLTTETQLPDVMLASGADKQRVDQYLRGLLTYEQGHRDIGRAAANEADRRINQVPPMANCAQLESAAHAAGHRAVNDFIAKEQQYDLSTEHGKTQGAVL